MAREQSAPDDDRSTTSGSGGRSRLGNSGLLNRRNYLKMAGLATAGAAFGTATAAATEYDVIELDPGERRVFRLDDGETFENVIIDQTARGAAGIVHTRGSTDWTIRNVAWRGPMSGTNRAIGCSDEGHGESLIENVYIGDGVVQDYGDRSDPSLGIWVAPGHNGHIDIRRVYVEGANDNGIYGSAPGTSGAGGTLTYTNCYAKNNWVSGFRIARGRVENCVAVNTSEGRDGRPIWVWNTDSHGDEVEIVDCDFIAGSYPQALDIGRSGGRCDVYMEGTQRSGRIREHPQANVNIRDGGGNGTDPEDRVPEGCPTSVEEVFEFADIDLGDGRSDRSEPSGTRLEIEGVGEYRIDVDGEIRPARSISRYLSSGDAYGNDGGEGWAEWYLTGSETAWYVDGEIDRVVTDAYEGEHDLTFYWDGDEFDPTDGSGDDADDAGPRTLEIEGVGEYRFEVDGAVEPTPEIAEWVEEGDAYATDGGEGWAEWYLTGSETAWEIDGDLTDVAIEPYQGALDLAFTIDGEPVDLAEFGVDQPRESTLEIEGVGEYRLEVDGEIEPSSSIAQWVDEGDAYANGDGEGWAEWYLTGSETAWELTGSLSGIETGNYQGEQDLIFRLDGAEIDPDDYSG